MKFDSEPIYAHSTLAQRPDTQFFHYDNNAVETAWKVDNEITVEEKRKVISDQNMKKLDFNTDLLLTKDKLGGVKYVSRRHDPVTLENLINSEVNETEDLFRSNVIKLSEKETEFEKIVTESELPELMVCFNEFEDQDYHVVKDICIDDGLPSLSKILVENGEVRNEGALGLDVNNDMTKPIMENVATTLNGTNPFLECDSKGNVANKYGFETLNGDSDMDIDETVNVDSAASIFKGTNPFVECDGRADVTQKFESESSIENGDMSFSDNVDGKALNSNGTNPFLECDSEACVAKLSGSESLSGIGEAECDEIVNVISDEKMNPEIIPLVLELNGTNPFLEGDSEPDVAYNSGSESLTRIGEEDSDEIVHAVSDEKTKPDEIVHADSDEKTKPEIKPPVQDLDVFSSPEPSNLDKYEDQQQSDQDTSRETHSGDSMMPSTAQESYNNNRAKEVPFNNQVESESITYDFDSSSPGTNEREDPQNTDCQQTVEILSTPSIEEETVDSRTASSRSFFIQYGYGETSFSAVGPLSGSIAFSGPIAYSGSTSLRSDSSTTSTRSFAFPILQSEWHSSPVKMAKAERGHYRKHRGWGLSLLCCRF